MRRRPELRDVLAVEIPAAIRKERGLRGWTQAQLAQRANLRPSAVGHFEAGSRLPSAINLRRLALALGCSVDRLLGIAVPCDNCGEDSDR